MVAQPGRGENAQGRHGARLLAPWSVAVATLLAVACGDDKRPSIKGTGGSAGAADAVGGKASGGSSMVVGAAAGDTGSEGGSGAFGNEGGSPGAGEDSGGSSGAGSGSGGSGGSSVVVPEPGRPGFGMVGVGHYSTSANYRLFGGVGDSPGANLKATSPNYILHGGLVGTTQP